MLLIICLLDGAAAIRLIDGILHRFRDTVRVHDDVAMLISGCTADDLDHRSFRAQEALLIRIEDSHERDLRHIETLTQKIDADQHIENARTQVTDDLRALDGRDVRVQIAYLHARFRQEIGEIFRHFLRECRDENALVSLLTLMDLPEQVIHLSFDGTHLDGRIQEPRWPDDLLSQIRLDAHFIRPRRRRHIDDLIDPFGEFVKSQRTVIQRRRQAEAIVDERAFSRLVAIVHRAQLRHRHMRLIDHDEEIFREVVQERKWRLAGLPVRHVAGIILDAGAVSDLLHHFQIIIRPLLQTLRLQELILIPELFEPPVKLLLDRRDGTAELIRTGDIVRCRENADVISLSDRLPCQDVELRQ